MTAPWRPCPDETWELVMEALPRPVSPEVATQDLRFYAYARCEVPSHEELARRWGWFSQSGLPSVKRVRRLKAAKQWKDEPEEERAGEGQAKGRRGAGKGQAEDGGTPEVQAYGAGKGQARGRQRAGEGPRARIDLDKDKDKDKEEPLSMTARQEDLARVLRHCWALWAIRRKATPRSAPRTAEFSRDDRKAAATLLRRGRTADQLCLVADWAFHGDDFAARQLRGEATADQVPNEHLSLVALYRPTKFGVKLAKATAWDEADRPGAGQRKPVQLEDTAAREAELDAIRSGGRA